ATASQRPGRIGAVCGAGKPGACGGRRQKRLGGNRPQHLVSQRSSRDSLSPEKIGRPHSRGVIRIDRNPQRQQMADESMIRTLAAQAEAIWPQEEALFARYDLGAKPAILDVGCGTGEITSRLALKYPGARVLGIDVLES